MTQEVQKIPVLLLKTKSIPADGYEEYFKALSGGAYSPHFVPVLEHKFNTQSLDKIKSLILEKAFTTSPDHRIHGGIIFTSQRAVEALSSIVSSLQRTTSDINDLLPSTLPLYVVGPATAKGLRSLTLPCPILGEETGNGEALAAFMLEHYNNTQYHSSSFSTSTYAKKPPLLFLVGEQRRDIIPKTLQSPTLPPNDRIIVEEMTIYETGVMQSFPAEFSSLVCPNVERGALQWVVVFSPTGCKAMLEVLGYLDPESGKVDMDIVAGERGGGGGRRRRRRTFIATIGPTTRDYLREEFGFEPDVCAAKPSAEGIGEAIGSFRLP